MAKKSERKSQAVSLRLRPATVAAAKKRAKALGRSVVSHMQYRQAKLAEKNERKTQAVSLRLRPSTVAAAKQRAKTLDRSVASYIEQLIRRDVDEAKA
jgi:hypothetical protein